MTRWLVRLATIAGPSFLVAGCDKAPMTFMRTFGPAADPVTRLGWGLIVVCGAVLVIIGAMVLVGSWRLQRWRPSEQPGQLAIGSGGGMPFIYVGVGVSTVVLLALMVWTLVTLKAVAGPQVDPAFTIEVRAHQWWWEARYMGQSSDRTFTTANELHIPVGKPVRLVLMADDVIHSFWIPALAGKTDVIPGQTNQAWLEASRPGTFRGQCTEFCGPQHAHMALYVVADEPKEFQSWWDRQLVAAVAPSSEDGVHGQSIFRARCGACHTVRGSGAGGILGPDLTHLMSRSTIASGTLQNNTGNLAGWIANAQGTKPGAGMPTLDLSGPDLAAVTTYMQSLR